MDDNFFAGDATDRKKQIAVERQTFRPGVVRGARSSPFLLSATVKAAFDQGKLAFPARLAPLNDADAFAAWLKPLYAKDWVVYAKPPFGGPAQVLKYLARYTHRVAISNARIVNVEGGNVTFRYKDYADAARSKTMTVSGEEFVRRFVQHVLPRGLVKVRHYGLLANRHREETLKTCRRLLLPLAVMGAPALPTPPPEATEIVPASAAHCPKCGGCRFLRMELPKEPPGSFRAAHHRTPRRRRKEQQGADLLSVPNPIDHQTHPQRLVSSAVRARRRAPHVPLARRGSIPSSPPSICRKYLATAT